MRLFLCAANEQQIGLLSYRQHSIRSSNAIEQKSFSLRLNGHCATLRL